MNKLSYGLFVITSKNGDGFGGCITNTVMQVTTNPSRVSLTVNKANYTHELIEKNRICNVSVLSEEAKFDIFERFGFKSGRDTDKFQNFTDYKLHENGVPYITKGTNAVMALEVIDSIDLGTHTMFIADVKDAFIISETPSATYAFYHKSIKPRPEAKKPEGGGKIVWRCTICGYEEEVDELPDDFECPLCHHPKSDFEKVVL